ncbi:putative lipid-binding transport protein (Tim44 family) [Actinomadura luteofluorescens]|uniref:Putative lipid-binding transport protein (Tim44 family) n=1 Tax=Actinomadura luteofluorescens TaxID=46163 RepID=A0A7Y9EPZ3_9ACTN|nr:DUF4349 domain-containing protein [Actinomadura luteofluorescens]NYD51020.1 putative lipid-binding transport protein (Tim44 family) [Actinomadura luteofluorescens]
MRIVRSITCALVVLPLAAGMAACGSGDHSSGASDSGPRGVATAPALPGGARRAEGIPQSAGAKRTAAPLPTGREVVHTADLRVRAGDVEAAAAKAKQLVAAAGGYVERESTSSDPARSEIALKIPGDRYAEVLGRLGTELGTKLSLSQQAEDVTGEVADVDARVRSAKATLESFRKLLGRANSVGEIMSIEQEISEREADLEALQARQKSLAHRTQFATVTVTLVSRAAPAEKDEPRGGFVGGLENGWHAFTAFVGGVAAVLGWLLPFLVAAAVVGLPALALRRRRRARSAADPAPEPEREPEREPQSAKAAVGAGEGPSQAPPQGPPPPA